MNLYLYAHIRRKHFFKIKFIISTSNTTSYTFCKQQIVNLGWVNIFFTYKKQANMYYFWFVFKNHRAFIDHTYLKLYDLQVDILQTNPWVNYSTETSTHDHYQVHFSQTQIINSSITVAHLYQNKILVMNVKGKLLHSYIDWNGEQPSS